MHTQNHLWNITTRMTNDFFFSTSVKSTSGTRFAKSGDYFLKFEIDGHPMYYITDYGLSTADRYKYNPKWVLTNNKQFRLKSELIIFDSNYLGTQIIHAGYNYSVSYYNVEITSLNLDSLLHCSFMPAMYRLMVINSHISIEIERYYQKGEEISKLVFDRLRKIHKIKDVAKR